MQRPTTPVLRLLASALLTGGLASSALAEPIYVDAAAGNDLNPGSISFPVKTIAAGISLAGQTGCPVYVAGGAYTDGFALISGIRVHGGFNPGNNWLRDGTMTSTITGPNSTITGSSINDAIIDGFTIVSGDAIGTGWSAYSIYLNNCTDIFISNCDIFAGNGAGGDAGFNGADGISGGNGAIGQPGCEDGGFLCNSCSRPQAGSGGTSPVGNSGGLGGRPDSGNSSGFPGNSGVGPAAGNGGNGTPPGTGTSCPNSIYWGQSGLDGIDGQDGFGGTDFGIGAAFYQPPNGDSGTTGAHGSGGGGGGGGGGGTAGGCSSYGTGGGGGGGGGSAGDPGAGGSGGGGSFAVYAFASTGITLTGSTLHAGSGGAGGDGGFGGFGGNGGLGGNVNNGCGANYGGFNEQDDASMGARGGDGGKGGTGGQGGGGGGGPSIPLFADSGTVALGSTTFFVGAAGSGGAAMFPGADGLVQQTLATTGAITLAADCNNNGIHDEIDIADGTLLDADCDGIPDACDTGCTFSADVNGDGVLDNGDIISFIDAFISGCK